MEKHTIYFWWRLCLMFTLLSNLLAIGFSQVDARAILQSTDVQVIDAGDNAWSLTGSWTMSPFQKAYDEQIHTSDTVGNLASIVITGTMFSITYFTAAEYGELEVYINNQLVGIINQSQIDFAGETEWQSPLLDYGTQNIQIIHAKGQVINIDTIKIYNVASTPTIDSSKTANPTITPSSTPLPPPSPSSTPTLEVNATLSSVNGVLGKSSPTSTPTPSYSSIGNVTPTVSRTSTPSSTVTMTATQMTGQKAYYISKSGNNTSGSSWATAWTGLDKVNWNVIQPGDTIYISGGANGVSYNGGFRLTKSGAANRHIIITSGANSPFPSGHSGPVIFEGGNNCLRVTGSYILVRNLICQHATDSGLRIEGTGTILESNTVRETYGQGIHVYHCFGCIVRGNRVTSFPNDGSAENRPYQTDGIVVYDSSNTLIEGNWIRLTNQYGPAHIDGIQASTSLGAIYENITIRYNYVENTKVMTSNSQAIYLTQMEGNVKIVGNIVNHPSGNQSVVSYLANNVGKPVSVFVIGNTIKCAGYRCLMVGDDKPIIKNNLIWQTGSGQLIDLKYVTNCDPTSINNNLYYAPNSTYPFSGSCGKTWKDWNSFRRLDISGIFGQNPNLDTCFRPSSTSISIGRGAILAEEYTQGLSPLLCGQSGPSYFLPIQLRNRNQSGGSSWDIGAYEN